MRIGPPVPAKRGACPARLQRRTVAAVNSLVTLAMRRGRVGRPPAAHPAPATLIGRSQRRPRYLPVPEADAASLPQPAGTRSWGIGSRHGSRPSTPMPPDLEHPSTQPQPASANGCFGNPPRTPCPALYGFLLPTRLRCRSAATPHSRRRSARRSPRPPAVNRHGRAADGGAPHRHHRRARSALCRTRSAARWRSSTLLRHFAPPAAGSRSLGRPPHCRSDAGVPRARALASSALPCSLPVDLAFGTLAVLVCAASMVHGPKGSAANLAPTGGDKLTKAHHGKRAELGPAWSGDPPCRPCRRRPHDQAAWSRRGDRAAAGRAWRSSRASSCAARPASARGG